MKCQMITFQICDTKYKITILNDNEFQKWVDRINDNSQYAVKVTIYSNSS